ncbi:MAG: hypothetical protein TE42_01585 [Candidatus Synechococcus spongiarum SP3]|uniref:Glycosyltransferase RgtA/B/C/D-like domain-containing protein n=1 Tax=Candidatus Synechococcus spongiarum SP3 TaxID=1604020 RepID=A0A0G2HNJ1_9SYNE|nr:MAG: hypothetical protein TE42_01585 [Candidatus Synechococcus spongiarum SP3]
MGRGAVCWLQHWLPLLLIWLAATVADRVWLAADQAIPAWDQAEYLNSAVDHGRALGLLPGGEWPGWREFLLLSPKIPPLASLVHGTVMAVAGEGPDQASWALALWHGLLLLALDGWARQLHSPRLALLALLLAAVAPSLVSLRVNFTLDLSLTAVTTAALWQLWRWQRPTPHGGRWVPAFWAALALAAALLVKQSALPVLAAPYAWAVVTGLGQRRRRAQLLAGMALVLALVLPWLHQNWITTIGGTHRAVVDSAASEGDPPVLSLGSLLYYPRLWWRQLGALPCGGAVAGLALGLGRRLRRGRSAGIALPEGWGWLLGCTVSGWLLTTMSPNKDARYIAPVLSLLILWLALGWVVLMAALQGWLGRWRASAILVAALVLAAGHSAVGRVAAVRRTEHEPPLVSLVTFLRQHTANAPVTLLMVPGSADLNEHTATTYGRMNQGQLLARSLGDSPSHHPLVLDQAEWAALATGDQGHHRRQVRQLSHGIRRDGRFQRVRQWPWSRGRFVELWQRRPDAKRGQPFARQFVVLAQGLAEGPQGLARFMEQIGPHHQLDGHFLYQQQVETWASQRLAQAPQATDALWSMAALAILRQDASTADHWLARLEAVLPHNPWPTTWRAAVLLVDWKPWAARRVAEAHHRLEEEPLLKAVGDLAAVVGGDLTRLPALAASWPRAVEQVQGSR